MAQIANSKLKSVLAALRECGKTAVPMPLALRMVTVQKTLGSHLEVVSEVNDELIEKYGEKNGTGQAHIGGDMAGWPMFVKESNELMGVEFDVGDPFVLFKKNDDFGWTEDVKTPVLITPNVMVDMDDLLEVRGPESPESSEKKGS